MESDYRPRISAEITQQQADILSHILPHGMKKPLLQVIVNGIIAIYDKGGLESLGAITSSYISIDQVVDLGLSKTRVDKIKFLEHKLETLRNGA